MIYYSLFNLLFRLSFACFFIYFFYDFLSFILFSTLNSSLYDLASIRDPPTHRKTVSIPITSPTASTKSSNSNSKLNRKTAHYIHKANTIGIPSEGDFPESVHGLKTPAPLNKPKLNFLGGIKSTLRSKHKNETSDSSSKEPDKPNELQQRRWSEANTPTVNKQLPLGFNLL